MFAARRFCQFDRPWHSMSVRLESLEGPSEHHYEHRNPPDDFALLDALLMDLYDHLRDCEDGEFYRLISACE